MIIIQLGFIIYLCVGIFITAHHLAQKLKGNCGSWKEIGDVFFPPRQDERRSPAVRSRQIEAEFGRPWDLWDPHADENFKFDHPTLSTLQARRYFGPMDMEVAGDQVLIYDLELGHVDLGGLGEITGNIFQTVIAIKPPELRLPPFIIHRKGTTLALDTLTPHRTKALFESELGTEVLIPFLKDRDWTVQWTGKCLIVYELGQLIEPERLAESALEVSEFFELLKSGPEVIEREFKALIRETAKKQTTRSSIGLKNL